MVTLPLLLFVAIEAIHTCEHPTPSFIDWTDDL